MANSVWSSGISGDWGNGANWTGGIPNDSSAAATIAAPGAYTVSIASTESFASGSLTLSAAGATLSIAGNLSLATGLTLGAGTIDGAGTLTVTGGTIQASADTTLSVTNLTIAGDVSLGSSLNDKGRVTVNSGTFTLGANAVTLRALTQSKPSYVSGTGLLTVSGAARLGSATLYAVQTGTGTTDLKGSTTINNLYGFCLDGGRILRNEGTLAFQSGSIHLGDNPFGGRVGNATIDNTATGVFDFQSDGLVIANFNGMNVFNNAGLVKKIVGTNNSYMQVPFNNSGTVLVSAGMLEFDDPSFSNQGTVIATGGGMLGIHPNSFANVSGTTLNGGAYEADQDSTIFLPNNASIVTDHATVTLSGANSVIKSFNATLNADIMIDSTLTTIATGGTLNLWAARDFTVSGAFTDNGRLSLGGGVFTAGSLAIGTGAVLLGKGVVAAAVSNDGVIKAAYGTLTLQQAMTGTGLLQINTGATLVLKGTLAAGGKANFGGANATLAISAVGSFADTVGGLAATDRFDLLKTPATSAKLNGSNQLVVTNRGAPVITIQLRGDNTNFDFSVAPDGKGGTSVVVGAKQTAAALDAAVLRMAQAISAFTPAAGLGQVVLGQQSLEAQPRLAASHQF